MFNVSKLIEIKNILKTQKIFQNYKLIEFLQEKYYFGINFFNCSDIDFKPSLQNQKNPYIILNLDGFIALGVSSIGYPKLNAELLKNIHEYTNVLEEYYQIEKDEKIILEWEKSAFNESRIILRYNDHYYHEKYLELQKELVETIQLLLTYPEEGINKINVMDCYQICLFKSSENALKNYFFYQSEDRMNQSIAILKTNKNTTGIFKMINPLFQFRTIKYQLENNLWNRNIKTHVYYLEDI